MVLTFLEGVGLALETDTPFLSTKNLTGTEGLSICIYSIYDLQP